tara:strand:- start:1422 stop:1796 length:375 start_codon:yes stop_codon:yes gene_type:complete
MSTRALYSFRDQSDCHSVYHHYDGYPANALKLIHKAKSAAWDLPRFEADEFAAAFCCIAKDKTKGGTRLSLGPHRHGDLSYRYDVWAQDNDLMVKIWEVDYSNEKLIDKGKINELQLKYDTRKE